MNGALVCQITLLVGAIYEKFWSYDLDLTALLRLFGVTGTRSFHDEIHENILYRVDCLNSFKTIYFNYFACLEFEVVHRCVLKIFIVIEIDWLINILK